MRIFYLFFINEEIYPFFKGNNTYYLYKQIKDIYHLPKSNLVNAYILLNNITNPINKRDVNIYLFDKLKKRDEYQKFQNRHLINNYYTKEESELIVNNSFIKIKSTKNNPEFFAYFNNKNNIFAIDFSTNDYFWLHDLRV